ncbi:GMP synthase [glutamine-hydrolyzing] isoform X3 [Rosa chinensis]|uniref:GMP synthase [glutamine-hydrolyzing] isoform X3 n=1 Tax=Rosa chinensis TaxID=74649 RepID=UPI001AD90CB7|nr:GMP synthase [glutamine-hydrolyzing] isoform X3 [Rosa chinensis]
MARWRLWWRAIRGFSRPKRVGDRQVVWMSHGDEVAKLPQGFRVMAQSQQGVVAAREWRFYGLQYHPESQFSPSCAPWPPCLTISTPHLPLLKSRC